MGTGTMISDFFAYYKMLSLHSTVALRAHRCSPFAALQGVENLFDRQDRMATYGPTFCDITWGAGGTTADLTLDIAAKMQNMVRQSDIRASMSCWNYHSCCW